MSARLALAACAAAVAASAGLGPPAAQPVAVTVLCPRGVQHAVTSLAGDFRRERGADVRFVFGTAGGLEARAATGEAADVVIGSAAGLARLEMRGVIAPGTRVDIGRVGVGIAVRAGAAAPDVSTADSLKRALLAARSLGYADPARGGQGGTHFARVVERLGVAEALRPKTRLFGEGLQALESVARGELELAAAPVSEILGVDGLALAGPLPPDLQRTLTYTAAVLARAPSPDLARAFVAFLAAPAARARLRAAGFDAE